MNRNELKEIIHAYLDNYNGQMNIFEIYEDLFKLSNNEDKLYVMNEVASYIFNSGKFKYENSTLINTCYKEKCINCDNACTFSRKCGDMFDYINVSIYCRILDEFIVNDMYLDDTYNIDNSSFCPKLKK